MSYAYSMDSNTTMDTFTASAARKELYRLMDKTAESHEPVKITGKRNKKGLKGVGPLFFSFYLISFHFLAYSGYFYSTFEYFIAYEISYAYSMDSNTTMEGLKGVGPLFFSFYLNSFHFLAYSGYFYLLVEHFIAYEMSYAYSIDSNTSMDTFTAGAARKELYRLMDKTAESHEPVKITGKRNNVVMISEEDWNAVSVKV